MSYELRGFLRWWNFVGFRDWGVSLGEKKHKFWMFFPSGFLNLLLYCAYLPPGIHEKLSK